MMISRRVAVATLAALVLLVDLVAGAAQAQTVVVVGERPMPAPIVEVVPAARVGYAWVGGHWVWRRGWFWVKGHYARGVVEPMPAPLVEVVPARPSPAHFWIKGHHAFESSRWIWHPGVWVRL